MKLNIRIEVEPNMDIIGDYWMEAEVNKIIKILVEYQDLFPCSMMEQ